MINLINFLKRIWSCTAGAFIKQNLQAKVRPMIVDPSASIHAGEDSPRVQPDAPTHYHCVTPADDSVDPTSLGRCSCESYSHDGSPHKGELAAQTRFHRPPAPLGPLRVTPLRHRTPHRYITGFTMPQFSLLNFFITPTNNNLNPILSSPVFEDMAMLSADAMYDDASSVQYTGKKESQHCDRGTNTGTSCQNTIKDQEAGKPEPGTTPPPKRGDDRQKLQPKSPKDCHRKAPEAHLRPDYTAEVVMEQFDDPNDPMPKGYWGTWDGYRMGYSAVEDYCPCGLGGGHFLICGHTVISQEPCGANCKTAQHDHVAFKCEQCEETVRNTIETKLTQEEKKKIALFSHEKNDMLYVALYVEAITKHMPTAKGNIAETVMSLVMKDYGRQALAYKTVDTPNEPRTLAETIRYFQKSGQREKLETRAQYTKVSLNTHEKRKDIDDATDLDASTQEHVQKPVDITQFPEVTLHAAKANKKQKIKLESHPNPITTGTRGIKRTATFQDSPELPVSDTSASHKKLKAKLESHREPITSSTRGLKRNAVFSFNGSLAKRVTVQSPLTSGVVSFLPAPLHKRVRDMELGTAQDTEGYKRRKQIDQKV